MSHDAPSPPSPPDMPRTLRLGRVQWVGLPLILLIPLLALFGVFSEKLGEAEASNPVLALTVQYPTRVRYDVPTQLVASVTNRSTAALPEVRVRFDEAYLAAFNEVGFHAGLADAYRVTLTALEPGETRQIVVDLHGEHYGPQRGSVVAEAAGAPPVEARLSTFILP